MTEAEKLLRACRNELYGSAPDELIDRIDAYLAAAPAAAHTDHPIGGSSALGWMQSARKWQQRAEQAEREREEVERLKLFIAETGARLTKEMYRDDDNRLGLSYDCKALAGDEMNTQYLTVQWQTERAIKAEQRFSDLQETLNPNSIGFLLANRLIDTEERAEQAQKDSEQGWQAFYALRKQVAADKYPMLTNIVRAAAPQGHGHITGTADVDAMNAEAWRQDASAEAIDAAQAKSGKP